MTAPPFDDIRNTFYGIADQDERVTFLCGLRDLVCELATDELLGPLPMEVVNDG